MWGTGKTSVIAIAALLASSLGGSAALANDDNGVVYYEGYAILCAPAPPSPTVYERKPAHSSCSEDDQNGLYMIGSPGGHDYRVPGWDSLGHVRIDPTDTSKWTGRAGTYWFVTGPLRPGDLSPSCLVVTPWETPEMCAMSVRGRLLPVLGIGAACHWSQGTEGIGELWTDAWAPLNHFGQTGYALTEVSWPLSAGGTLLVSGAYRRTVSDGREPPKGEGVERPFAGVQQWQGGAPCLKNTLVWGEDNRGAANYALIGMWALL